MIFREKRDRLLGAAEQLDLLNLLGSKFARHLATIQFLPLNLPANALDDLRVGQRRHVTHVGKVADRGQHTAHNLARTRLGHIGDDPTVLRPRDLANLRLDGPGYFLLNLLAWLDPRLQRDIYLHHAPAQLVEQGNRSGFGNLIDGQAGRFDLFGAQAMAGHIDNIIDPAKNAEVAIGGQHCAIAGEVRPVVPVFALSVAAVFRIVGLYEAFRLAPDRLKDARPGVADANVACLPATSLDLVALLIVDYRIDAYHPRTTTPRFHRLHPWQRAAQ